MDFLTVLGNLPEILTIGVIVLIIFAILIARLFVDISVLSSEIKHLQDMYKGEYEPPKQEKEPEKPKPPKKHKKSKIQKIKDMFVENEEDNSNNQE